MCAPAAAVCLLMPAAVAAQAGPGASVVGRVVSEEGSPLPNASVAARAAADSTVVAGTMSAADGTFRIAGIPPGRYFVQASYVGYAAGRSDPLELEAGETVDLGTLRLRIDAVELDELTVETEPAPVVFASDRTIYGTANMPAVAGGVVTELLQSIPELEVDLIDGTVTLDGATPRIHINGRPAPMQGEALSLFLEHLPADRVERIEVIPNPSARYDAEGAGGIVNIVLKEDVELGLSGSVSVNAGSRGRSGGRGRVGYQKGDVTVFGGASLGHSDRESTSYDLRQNLIAEPTTYLRQDAWSERGGLSGSVDLAVRYDPAERTELWIEGGAGRYGNDSDGVRTTTHLDADRVPTLRYDRVSASDSRRVSADVDAGFSHEFDARGHELEVEVEVETGGDRSDERVETQVESGLDEGEYVPPELMFDDEAEDESEVTLEADYARPLGEDGRLELGYRGRIDDRASEHERRSLDPSSPGELLEDLGFEHRQVFNSGYLTVSRELGPLGVQLGVRAERATTRFTRPSGETFRNDYHSFFPSGNVSLDLGGGRRLRLSYSRRVRRPSPRILDPTDRSNDPLNREVGNPDIDPNYTHSLRADVRWTGRLGTLRLAPFYRRTTGDWERIRTVDADGVSTVMWENLSLREDYGARLTASFRRVHGMDGYVSVSGQQEARDASNLSQAYSGTSFRWSTRARLSAEIGSNLAAQAMLSYRPAREVAQGRIGSRVMMHFGFRQRLLDGRASIRVGVVDPFDLYESSFESRDPTHVQVGTSERTLRSARVSFSYSFGGAEQRGERRGRR